MVWNERLRRRDVFGLIAGAGLVPIMKPTSAVGAPAFPVTVDHALGTTRIMKEPKRIVTLGWNGEDAIVALGHIPIAMPKRALFDSGIFPWVEDKLGAAKPHLLTNDLDYEMLVALRPDLILAVFSGVDDNAYKRLSRIAPTVVYTSGVWQADWREQILQTGRALGKETDAVALIDQTNQLVNALGKQFSELEGKTFTFGTFSAGSNAIGVYLPADPRIAMLMELGLKASPGIVELASQDENARSTSVSLENIGSIDADILIMWYGEGARDAAEAQPLFAALNAVKRGSYVALEDPVSVWSTSALSVLSIPYGFPKFVPRLAEAARKAEQQ